MFVTIVSLSAKKVHVCLTLLCLRCQLCNDVSKTETFDDLKQHEFFLFAWKRTKSPALSLCNKKKRVTLCFSKTVVQPFFCFESFKVCFTPWTIKLFCKLPSCDSFPRVKTDVKLPRHFLRLIFFFYVALTQSIFVLAQWLH